MKRYLSMKPLIAAVVGAALSGNVSAFFTITDLGTLGGTQSRALGLNASGVVVGQSSLSSGSNSHAFLNNGSMTDLHSSLTGSGGNSLAWAINDSGQVTGSTSVLASGFRYTSGTVIQFNSIFSASASAGRDINNSGDVVGYYSSSGTPSIQHSFLYTGGGVATTLPTLGGTHGRAYGVSDNGDIVGEAQITGDTAFHAFHYSGGVITDIGTLGGLESIAREVNNSGVIVGMSKVSLLDNDIEHPFIYDGGVMTDIGTLGGIRGIAYAVNNDGDVVGRATNALEETRAILYSGGVLYDLNDLLPSGSGWVLTEATDINDERQIVGYGRVDGEDHAFLLTPGC